MSKIKEHFGNKTGEQIVSFFMFVFTVAIMFFCHNRRLADKF